MTIVIVWGLCSSWLLQDTAFADSGKRAVEHATELLRSGDVDGAIASLQKSTESNDSAEAYHLLGQIYFKAKKKPREAAEAFTHALKLKPAYPDALNDLAEVYLAQGKTAEAEQTLKRAIEVDPKHEDSYLDLARLYESRHDIPSAIQIYQRLLAVRPKSAEGLFGLAMLHEGQGNNDA
ncbi:MAG TPA: tetratricopeptide repeat protein, partial [Candidatus Binatia bacterium]|nr:tetratricopeptide repeat protein [Candidatus Binatia bacterium]